MPLIYFKIDIFLPISTSQRYRRKQLTEQPEEDILKIFFSPAVRNKELKISQIHERQRQGQGQ